MATKNPRMNITLNDEQMGILSVLAKENEQSLSMALKDLVADALSHNEDARLVKLCDDIIAETTEWHSAEEVWGK